MNSLRFNYSIKISLVSFDFSVILFESFVAGRGESRYKKHKQTNRSNTRKKEKEKKIIESKTKQTMCTQIYTSIDENKYNKLPVITFPFILLIVFRVVRSHFVHNDITCGSDVNG